MATTSAETLASRLAAILHADIVGYSRLSGEDELGTHRTVRAYLGLIRDIVEATAAAWSTMPATRCWRNSAP